MLNVVRALLKFSHSREVQAMKTTPIDYQLLSTTTSLGRVRGFTIDLLYHLRDGPKRCCELAEITGKTRFYVWRYLRNMQNYGLTCKEGSFFWKLTDIGVNFLNYLDNIYYIYNSRKKVERKKKESRKKVETSPPKRLKQVSIQPFLLSSSLHDAEKTVVEVLVEHYNKTGSKFLYFKDVYEIAEKFGFRPDQANQVMMNLKQDHIAYSYRDRSYDAWKIGLYKAFVESLRLQGRS